MTHHDVLAELPAYVASRLDAEAAAAVAAHLGRCERCAGAAEDLRKIAAALRDGGDALFGPHPSTEELAGLARGTGAAGPALARHLEVCASCSLEVEVFRRRGGAGRTAAAGTRRAWTYAAAALAAGLLAGSGLTILLRTPPPPPAAGVPGPGARPFILLTALRSGEDHLTFRIDPDETAVLVGMAPDLPPDVSDGDAIRFEIRWGEGGLRTAWAAEEAAGRVRRLVEEFEAVTFPVPVRDLPSGPIEMRVTRAGPGGGEILLRLPFEIVRAPDRISG
jgi:hypothetical protein